MLVVASAAATKDRTLGADSVFGSFDEFAQVCFDVTCMCRADASLHFLAGNYVRNKADFAVGKPPNPAATKSNSLNVHYYFPTVIELRRSACFA
jgi:hypothetical protein